MFNNELMADIHFIVGPPGSSEKVPAHKVRFVRNKVSFQIFFTARNRTPNEQLLIYLSSFTCNLWQM